MSKISRVDAFYEITNAMRNNDMEKANSMLKIVTESITFDKNNNTFSEYIELKGKKQESLFKNIIISDEE